VASDVYPYSNSILRGYSGYIAKTKRQWVKHLSWLIESEELRQKLASQAKEVVLRDFDVNKSKVWQEFYERIASDKPSGA